MNESDAMREIHAIRVQNFERTKYMSPTERSRIRAESVLPITKKFGFRVVPNRRDSTPHVRELIDQLKQDCII